MQALKIARLTLLFSLLVCGAILLLGLAGLIHPGLGLLAGMTSGAAIAASAAACVIIQGALFLRRLKK